VTPGASQLWRQSNAVAHFLPPTRRRVRVALGLLWLLDAGLQAAPAPFTADWWRTDLAQSVMGQPMPVNHSIFWAVNIIAAHPAVWNSCFVAIQAAFGLALIAGRFDRVAIVASIPWALGVWWVGEGFGTIPTGFALLASGSPGPVLLYPLLGILAWPTRARSRCSQFSDDAATSAVCRRTGMAAWVVLWAGQALLQIPWSMPSGRVLVANVEENSQGQPRWLEAVAHVTGSVALHHGVALSAGLAVAQVLIGLGVLVPRARRWALGVGIAVSLVFWVGFQYLGGIAAGGATDPGSAPLMILLALSMWPVRARESKRRISPDRLGRPTPVLSPAGA
jgi:hypothetical protein